MSAIIDKVYDATKRIYKSVFKGAPNLITTADLNRQMSAFQAQLENLYRFVGPITDLSFTFEQDNETPSFSASYTLSKMVARGCDFTNLLPASGTLSGDLPVTANERLWVLLTATQKLVTYADDPSHDIAGAKFSDGTTYPAADQIVYETASLVTSPDNYDSVENVVEALGYFYRDSSTPQMVKFMPNFVPLKTLYTGHMFPASPQMTLPQAIAANTLTDGNIPSALNVGMGSTFNVALKKFYDKYASYTTDTTSDITKIKNSLSLSYNKAVSSYEIKQLGSDTGIMQQYVVMANFNYDQFDFGIEGNRPERGTFFLVNAHRFQGDADYKGYFDFPAFFIPPSEYSDEDPQMRSWLGTVMTWHKGAALMVKVLIENEYNSNKFHLLFQFEETSYKLLKAGDTVVSIIPIKS